MSSMFRTQRRRGKTLWEDLLSRHLLLVFWISPIWTTPPTAGPNVQFLSSRSELRSIYLQWLPLQNLKENSHTNSTVEFLVKHCESSWDDELKRCHAQVTNSTEIQIKNLRPSTKYLVTVEELPNRSGRMLVNADVSRNMFMAQNLGNIKLDRSRAVPVETQKYAVRNVECLKGRTNATVETGEAFEGLISVQRPDGKPEKHCSVKGNGAAQQLYYLDISHADCAVELLDNGTVMNAVILIQEHPGLVLGSDQSFRISCNYQPAVIHIETGMGMDSQRQVVRVGGPDPSAHPPLKPSSASPPNLGHEQSITVNTLTTPSPPFIALSSEQRPLKVDGQRISLKRPSEPKQLPSTEDFYRSNGPYPATLAEDALSPRTDGRERQPPSNEDMYTDDEPSSTEKGRRILQSESDMNRLSQNVAVQAGKLGFDRDFPLRIQTHLPTFPLVARPMEETDGTMASPAGDQEVAVASSVQKPVDSGGGDAVVRGMPLMQVVVVTIGVALAGIVLLSLLIWLLIFRQNCLSQWHQPKTRILTENERYG